MYSYKLSTLSGYFLVNVGARVKVVQEKSKLTVKLILSNKSNLH